MIDHGISKPQLATLEGIFGRHLETSQSVEIWLFGSRATGHHKKYSDVDLLVRATPALSSRQLREIREDLKESNLPFQFDLVPEEALYGPYAGEVQATKKLLLKVENGPPHKPTED